MRIGFIGTGHIAAPMARFLARKGHEIIVTRRNADVSAALARDIGARVEDPQGVIDAAEVVVLCLRPQHADAVLAPLAFRPGQQIVSVMAGVSASDLDHLCAPAEGLVQTIPLGFLEQGGCPLAAFGNTGLLTELFAPDNPVVRVASEEALNAHFALCAMVPGMLDLLATGADWLTKQTGDAEAAAFYTSQMMAGFLAAMPRDAAGELGTARDGLATEGTISLQMTTALRDGKTHAVLSDALTAIGQRLKGSVDG